MSVCTESAVVYCSGPALKDPVTTLINCMGNTKVLSREVESKLTRIIRKGLDMDVSIAAREAKLKRPLFVSEVVQLLVSPCTPSSHFRRSCSTQCDAAGWCSPNFWREFCVSVLGVPCRASSLRSMCCWCGRMRPRRATC